MKALHAEKEIKYFKGKSTPKQIADWGWQDESAIESFHGRNWEPRAFHSNLVPHTCRARNFRSETSTSDPSTPLNGCSPPNNFTHLVPPVLMMHFVSTPHQLYSPPVWISCIQCSGKFAFCFSCQSLKHFWRLRNAMCSSYNWCDRAVHIVVYCSFRNALLCYYTYTYAIANATQTNLRLTSNASHFQCLSCF